MQTPRKGCTFPPLRIEVYRKVYSVDHFFLL